MDGDTLFFTAWLTLHDKEFTRTYAGKLEPALFPRGPLQALTALALEQSQRYRRTTTATVVDLALTNGFRPESYGSSEEEMRRAYRDLDSFAIDDDARSRAVEECLSWITLRRMGMALDTSLSALAKGDEEGVAQALSDARKLAHTEEPPLRLDEHLAQALRPLPDNAVPTGLFCDHIWKGGVRPNELAVLLATTNLGKSMALCFFAIAAYRANLKIVYYTFELSPEEILRRIVSGLLRRAAGTIAIDEAAHLLRQIKLQRSITEGDIEIRSGARSVADVALDIEELEQEGRKPHLIVLDSADDLRPRREYQTLYLTQGEIYRELRELTLERHIAMWTSTQATKDAIDKAKISLRHMGDSFWKARRAHFVLGFSQSEAQRADPFGAPMRISVLKDSQHGTPGRWADVRPQFGPSHEGKGYPGFKEVESSD